MVNGSAGTSRAVASDAEAGSPLPLTLLMRFLLHDAKPVVDREVPFWLVNSEGDAGNHYTKALPSWYSLKEAYTRDRDFQVVSRFADDFVFRASHEQNSRIRPTCTNNGDSGFRLPHVSMMNEMNWRS